MSTSSTKDSTPVATTTTASKTSISIDHESSETVSAPTILSPIKNSDLPQSAAPLQGLDTIVSNLPKDQNGTTSSTNLFPSISDSEAATFFQDLLGVDAISDSTTTTSSLPLLPLPPLIDSPRNMSFDLSTGEDLSLAFDWFVNPDMVSDEFDNTLFGSSQEAASPIDAQRASRAPSSESEGSNAIPGDDHNPVDAMFGLDSVMLDGSAPPAYNNVGGAGDPTMKAFGDAFFDNSSMAAFLAAYAQPQPQQQQPVGIAPMATTAPAGFNVNTISPSQLSTPLEGTPASVFAELPAIPTSAQMKRKFSESSADTTQQPKKRGRPRKDASADMLVSTIATPAPKRQSSKPSVSRPKAVVPEKYFRDGSAQAALGMTKEQILDFPDFETLQRAVSPAHAESAAAFGELMEQVRLKAAESAQAARSAKDAKLVGLQSEIERLKAGFLELLTRGAIDEQEYLRLTGA